jgi:hypothetical protein
VEGAPRVLVRSGGELITALALMMAVVLTGCEKPMHYSDWQGEQPLQGPRN